MINYKYKISNKQGRVLYFNDHETDSNNVYALQSYPIFQKAIKNTEVERLGQNNYWDFYSYYGKQSITFSGKIVAEDHQKLEQMKTQLQMLFVLPIQPNETNDGYVTMEWTDDDGVDKTVDVKLTADIQFDRALGKRFYLDFIIQMKTRDNFVRGVNLAGQITGIRGYLSTGGIYLPTKVPIRWGANYKNTITVNVNGVIGIPKIRLVGERQQVINNPRIHNITTGETFKVNIALADHTKWIEIDTDKGTVLDQDGEDKSSFVDVTSSFLSLVNGINQLVYLSDEDPSITNLLPERQIYTFNPDVNNKLHEPIDNKTNTHTLNNVVLTTDRFDTDKQAYSFNGNSNSHVDLGKTFVVNTLDQDYTFMCWIKAKINPNNDNPYGEDYQTILLNTDGTSTQLYLGLAIKSHKIFFWNYGWGAESIESTNLYDGNWHHICAVHPKTPTGAVNPTEFYLDGQYLSSMASGKTSANGDVTTTFGLGMSYQYYNTSFKGDIDLAIIENRRWSPTEIFNEYLKQNAGDNNPRLTVNYKEFYAS